MPLPAPTRLILLRCRRPRLGPTRLQLMWAFGAANCRDAGLLHAAAERAAALGRGRAFSSSRQPRVLLAAFRALGLQATEADAVLLHELRRLRASEEQRQVQQEPQAQQEGGGCKQQQPQ